MKLFKHVISSILIVVYLQNLAFCYPMYSDLVIRSSDPAQSLVSYRAVESQQVEDVQRQVQEPVKQEPIKQEPIKQEPVKQEPIKQEPIKQEPVKQEPIKQEPIKQEPVKQEPIKQEPIKQEPIKQEPVKQQPIKEDVVVKEEVIDEEPIKQEPDSRGGFGGENDRERVGRPKAGIIGGVGGCATCKAKPDFKKAIAIALKGNALAAGATAVVAAPAVLKSAKVAALASLIPVKLAAKGAIIGTLIAKPIIIKSAIVGATAAKLSALFVGKPIAIGANLLAGAEALRAKLKAKKIGCVTCGKGGAVGGAVLAA